MKSVMRIASVVFLMIGLSGTAYAAEAAGPIENSQDIRAGLPNGDQTSEGYGAASQAYGATAAQTTVTLNNNLDGPTSGDNVSAVPELDGSSAAIALGLLFAVGLIVRERKRAKA